MYVLYLFLIINVSSSPEACSIQFQKSESVLCRSCGSDILSTDAIISKLSPVSLHSFNESIFNSDDILIQVLPKDYVLQFPIITAKSSACLGMGEWDEDDYWFPGYHWKPCGCSKCGAFIGLLFEPIDPSSVGIPEKFFGLVPAHLVDKSFTDSLIQYIEINPKYGSENSL